MPRGRHRHSPPLHRLLPPSAVAGASVLSAAGAWLLTDPVLLRSLAAVAAAAAVSGAVLMRRWDRSAGRRVAEVTRGRANDAWQHEERVAELESEVEEARELRAKLETKLRAKRVELAKLRNEHAELLRRYAAAETGRASALEGRRKLAVEATAPQDPKELAATGASPTAATYLRAAKALEALTRNAEAQGRRAAGATARPAGKPALEPAAGPGAKDRTGTGGNPAGPGPGAHAPAGVGKAPAGSGDSPANGTPDTTANTAPGAVAPADGPSDSGSGGKPGPDRAESAAEAAAGPVPGPRPDGTPDGDGDGGGSRTPAKPDAPAAPQAAPRTTAATGPRTAQAPAQAPAAPAPALPAGPAARALPAAPANAPAPAGPGAIVPYGPRRAPGATVRRPEGGFDFFGANTGAPAPGQRPDDTVAADDGEAAIAAAQRADLADVVGDEALAEHQQHTGRPHPAPHPAPAGEVIDLTAHDETEKLDMSGLRNALSS
ncbi:coiled-coil domain-containing protein [Streptomyces sp. NPDC094448]|uniref:coiled-coil domain-containing protein n=1 Tax=Streptomyces sp. NPDC094448 TaxID=3366063 RepID=UPI00380919BC